MAKFQSPLLGYNNNVRHRGRVFHIQTEDSGVNHPHIITHLFMDGGRILKSVKRSYAEHVGAENMSETVRVLMKEQHKAMFIALRDGQFDDLVEGTKKPSGAIAAPAAPGPTAAKAQAAPPAATAQAAQAVPPAATPPIAEALPTAPTAQALPAAATAQVLPAAATAPTVLATPAVQAPDDARAAAAQAEVAPPSAQVPREPSALVTPPAPAVVAPGVAVNPMAVASVVTVSSDQVPAVEAIADSRPSPITKQPRSPRAIPHDEPVPATIDEGRRALASQLPPADPPLPPELEALLRDELPPPPAMPTSVAARAKDDAEPDTTREPERRRSAQELTLDFDALERDSGPSPIFQHSDLPPPPKNLFAREPRTGAYSTVEVDAHHDDTGRVTANRPQPSTARTPQPQARPAASSRAPTPRPPSEGRYAPARPAAIFGAAPKPPPSPSPSPSIFSDDLVSDKSLDEVILSYLAEDLDPPRRK